MHELSICGAIVDTVNEHAGTQPVRRVNLVIGHFRQIVPETLQYCWTMRTGDTQLAGCELAITSIPAVVDCRACGVATTLSNPILVCGGCGSGDVALVSGDEFLIESIDLRPLNSSSEEHI